ncbi:MAG: DoxX family membrane protein [Gemmatimonadetes bacterium]|nr:DoxX family membrane protein [Gemmatimonadota bacterium]
MRTNSLAFLRVALGLFTAAWGIDKLLQPAHGAKVAEKFYGGLTGTEGLMPAAGAVQCALALLIVVGLWRRIAYPALSFMTLVTLAGVWRSLVDPWGRVIAGGNVVFVASLPLFAATLVLWAFADDDAFCLDAWRVRGKSPGRTAGVPT